ncbi:MAG: methyltransferase, partial [Candidatus Hydrogenedentota bacterium]
SSGPVILLPARFALVACAGFSLGAWAALTMGISRIRAHPEPADDAQLVTSGPYHYMKHPMYWSVLLVCGSWVAARPRRDRVINLLALAAVLCAKMRREEKLLAERFPDYALKS